MPLADLLNETLDGNAFEYWQRERMATPVRAFAVRLHVAGLSLRETASILELLDVDRSHQAIWQWKERLADSGREPPTATPSRIAVDKSAVQIGDETCWVYAAINVDSKLLLDFELFGRRGTDPPAAFLHRLTEKHDVSDAEFLVDDGGYLIALYRVGLSGQLEYRTRNHIEKWFQTLQLRTDRFHTIWVGSRQAVRHWLKLFRRYYNRHRPHQALNKQNPAEVI